MKELFKDFIKDIKQSMQLWKNIFKIIIPILIAIFIILKNNNTIDNTWLELLIIYPILTIGLGYLSGIAVIIYFYTWVILLIFIFWIIDKVDERKERKKKIDELLNRKDEDLH